VFVGPKCAVACLITVLRVPLVVLMENKNGAEMVAVAVAAVFFLAGHCVGGSSSVCLCV
jgi:hypothetical protein